MSNDRTNAPTPAAIDAARRMMAAATKKRPGWSSPWIDLDVLAGALDAFAKAAVEKERERLGFGQIVMMSEQRNRPGLPPRWAALARGRKQAVIADSEDEARIAALAIPIENADSLQSG